MINLPKSVSFDGDDFKFSQLFTQDNGSKSIYINYKQQPLFIQTPKMVTPFGLSKYSQNPNDKDASKNDKYSLQLSLKGNTQSSKNFMKFLSDLQSTVLNEGVKCCKEWFKKTYSMDVLQELFTNLIVYPKNKEGDIIDTYPPTFKLNIPVVDGVIQCECFDEKGDPVTLSTIPKSSEVSAIIRVQGIWFAGSKFGVSIKAVQLRVQKPSRITGYSFNDDNEDEDNSKKEDYIDSSDDEDDTNEEVVAKDEEDGEEMQFNPVEEEEGVNGEEQDDSESNTQPKTESNTESNTDSNTDSKQEASSVTEPVDTQIKKRIYKKKT